MKKVSGYLVMILLLVMASCDSNSSQSGLTEEKRVPAPLQSTSMLLNGHSEAVCYSGFRTGQHPDRGKGAVNPSEADILEDLQILKTQTPFRFIRLYDCDENSQMVLEVIKEKMPEFKVLLGIWLRAELSAHETCAWLTEPIPQKTLDANKKLNELQLAKGIELANTYKDVVVAVNVGNEALVEWNDHKVDTDTIIGYVKQVQAAIEQPVSVADNYKWWAEHGKQLSEIVDFVSIHTYPIWEGKDIDSAMFWTIQNVNEVMQALPGKQIVITEAGWASKASEFGERSSEEKQQQYTQDLLAWSKQQNITTFIFEAFDEDWKGDPGNPDGAEKHWGIYTVDREPKKAVELFDSQAKMATTASD